MSRTCLESRALARPRPGPAVVSTASSEALDQAEDCGPAASCLSPVPSIRSHSSGKRPLPTSSLVLTGACACLPAPTGWAAGPSSPWPCMADGQVSEGSDPTTGQCDGQSQETLGEDPGPPVPTQGLRLPFPQWAWRRKWQPTPVSLPGEFHGQRSLAGYSPEGLKELDTTE